LIGNLDFNDEAPIEVSKRRKRAVEVKAFTAVLGPDAAAAGLAVIGAIALDRFGDQLPMSADSCGQSALTPDRHPRGMTHFGIRVGATTMQSWLEPESGDKVRIPSG
jgi:hypothetical protein